MTPPAATIVEGDIFDDSALDDATPDDFVHGELADVVTGLLLAAKPPLNVAIFSPWGSGKSSFFTLLRKRLQTRSPNTLVVRYDAWKFGGKALKRHFVLDVAEQLGLNKGDQLTTVLNHSTESSRLRYGRWLQLNGASLVGAIGFAALAGIGWASLHAWALADWLNKPLSWKDAFTQVLPEVGYVMALVLAAIVFGPKAMEAAVVKTSSPAADSDEQFSAAFSKLVDEALNKHWFRTSRNASRLIIYIDELDRCEATDVVKTLTDLKTFLHHPKVVFVVAADREALVEALSEHKQATPVRVDAPYYSTPGAFIDKVFQHQVTLPPFRPSALSSFATREAQRKTSGIWAELKDPKSGGGDKLFRETIYCLVPAHVRSPRRVKVLLNNFATTARMAQSRGIDWRPRAREVAILTVLNTEFPDVAASMLRVPQLLKHLRTGPDALAELTKDQQAIVARFVVRADVGPDETADTAQEITAESEAGPAGGFLGAQNESNEELRRLGQTRLNQQLHAYLRKLVVIGERGISDPRRDLLYLRAIGVDEGLDSPTLSDLIDIAADLNPEDVITAFDRESPPTRQRGIAIALLSRQAQEEEAVQKANLLEVACRLIEALPTKEDVVALRSHVPPEVLTSVDSELWRDEMIPGAIALATSNNSKDVTEKLFDKLDLDDPASNELTARATKFLGWATPEVAEGIATSLAAASDTNPGPVIDVVRRCEPDVALKVWNRSKGKVREFVRALADEATAEPAPAPSAAATTEALDQDPGVTVASFLQDLIDAALQPSRREDNGAQPPADADLFTAVLEFAQHCNDRETTEWIYDQSEQLFTVFTGRPDLIRMHIALAIRYDTPDRWLGWLPEWEGATESPPSGSNDAGDAGDSAASEQLEDEVDTMVVPWATNALKVVVQAIPAVTGTELDGAIKIANALIPTADPEDYSLVLDDIAAALGATAWADADDAARRNALRTMATALEVPEDTDKVDDLLVTDLINATVGAVPTDGLYKALNPLLSSLSLPAAQQFAEHLTTQIPGLASAIQPDAMKLRIQAGIQGQLPPVPFAELTALPADELSTIAAKWLATDPALTEVSTSLAAVKHQRSAIGTYASTLSSDQRASLWVAATEAETTYAIRKAIGEPGVGSAAVKHIADLVAAETHQTSRSNLISQLIEQTTLDETPPHAEATQLSLYLFGLGNKGDKRAATKLVAHSGGVSEGNKTKVATLVKAFLKTNDHGVGIGVQGVLYKLELANKPKPTTEAAKSLLRRLWSKGS